MKAVYFILVFVLGFYEDQNKYSGAGKVCVLAGSVRDWRTVFETTIDDTAAPIIRITVYNNYCLLQAVCVYGPAEEVLLALALLQLPGGCNV